MRFEAILWRLKRIQEGVIEPSWSGKMSKGDLLNRLSVKLGLDPNKHLCLRELDASCFKDMTETRGAVCGGSNCGWCHNPYQFSFAGIGLCEAMPCTDEEA